MPGNSGNGYGGEYAVVLPQQGTDVLQWSLQQGDRRRQEELARQKLLRSQQEDLAKFVDDKLDYKNFATGTVADQVVNNSLSDLRQKYAGMIKQNPDMGIANLMYQMQTDVGKLNQYSTNAKLVRANIEDAIKGYSKDKGVNVDDLKKGAIRNAFVNIDPTNGKFDIKEPDPTTDYVAQYLQEFPEKVIQGTEPISTYVSGLKTTKQGDTKVRRNKAGFETKYKYNADLLPHQDVVFNNDGSVKGLSTKADPSNPDLLDPNVYDQYFGDPVRRASLDIMVNKVNNGKALTPTEKEYQRKKVAKQMLDLGQFGGGFTQEDVEKQRPVSIHVSTAKEKPENVFQVLKNIKAGDLSYVADATPDANGLINITTAIPGSILYSGRIKKTENGTASKEAFNSISFDPKTKSFYVQDEPDSPLKEIPAAQERRFFKAMAEANNTSVKKFMEIWDKATDMKPTSPDNNDQPSTTPKKWWQSGMIGNALKGITGKSSAKKNPSSTTAPQKKKYNPATGKFE